MSAGSNSQGQTPVQSPGSSLGGSPDTVNPIEHVMEQVQGIQLNQENRVDGSTESASKSMSQDDTEMAEAAPNQVDSLSNTAGALPTSPVVSSGLSQASEAMSNPSNVSSSMTTSLDSVKKLIWRRDSFVRLLLDMVEGTDINNEQGQKHILDMRTKVEDMNKLISTVKHSVKLSETNVTAFISGDNEGISLSKQDLPKLQLRFHATKYFPNEITYDSIHNFLRSFEKVILSSGKTVEDVWRRYSEYQNCSNVFIFSV